MQRVVTARLVVVADTADPLPAHLLVAADTVALRPADMADLRKDLRPVASAAADSDRLRKVAVTAVEDSAAADLVVVAAADSVRPVAASHLPVDRWVLEWATTSTPRCRWSSASSR
jgi:hypothetical protein